MIRSKLTAVWRQVAAIFQLEPSAMKQDQTQQLRKPLEVAAPTNRTNANIWSFLDYYCLLPAAPNYAVLVKGPWGSGKTHLVKSFFVARPELKILYVSLYGMRSIADIESEFFSQLHPRLSSPGMKIAAAVMKGILKNAKIDVDVFTGGKVEADGKVTEFNLPKFLSDAGDRILIFDDLERAKMPLKEVLGYINTFVEHDDSKVILIANEDQILTPLEGDNLTVEGQEYKDTKEKLVGKSFAIEADLSSAYEGFLIAVADPDIRQFLAVKRSEIETLFKQSQTDNLRFLRQTMLDFERLTEAMEPAHRRHIAVLGDIMPPYFALSFEMKANRISAKDVTKFGTPDWGHVLSGKAEAPQTKTGKRYPEVKFENAILGMDVIRDLLFDSAVDADAIKVRVAASKYYSAAKGEPAWRALWYAMQRSDKDAQESMETVEQMFRERAFTKQGEMLHVFGERLWLSRIGAITASLADVVRESKQYIDDIYDKGQLDPTKSMRDILGHASDSYEGLGFMDRETSAFAEIATYLHAKEHRAEEDGYHARAQALMELMETDTSLFLRQLTLSNSADNIYAQIPILLWIDPAEFAARVMALQGEQRRNALMAFSQRYTYLNIAPQLVPELDWLENVKTRLEADIAKLPPIPRYAMSGSVTTHLTAPLKAARTMADGLKPVSTVAVVP
jgi:hypothetical protein